MTEQVFSVDCGFFNAVNHDRTYTAEDMNKPYSRVLADGVFATNQGTPSDDLQVVRTNGTQLKVTIKAGQGIFASKWFKNPSQIIIEIPSNDGVYTRIDSVIVQVDERDSGRVGNIVYRTGSGTSSLQPPAINTVAHVTEYRVANIEIDPGATSLSTSKIHDLRGSAECPWVTSLIQQVDTSTLFDQFNDAYQQQYNDFDAEFDAFIAQKTADLQAAIDGVTGSLSLATNVIYLTSEYTAAGTVSNIPINITSYDPNADLLMVYINGMLAPDTSMWALGLDMSSIDLVNPIAAGNKVSFVCLKSVIAGDLSSVATEIQALDDKVDDFMLDSGWAALTLTNAQAYDSDHTPSIRKVGNRIYLRGAIKGITAAGTKFTTLPVGYRPEKDHIFTSSAISSTSSKDLVITVKSNGEAFVTAASGSISSGHMIPICTTFVLN